VGRTVKKSEQHPIAHCEVHSPVVLVVVLLGVLLRLEEALPDLDQECVAVPEHGIDVLRLSRPLLMGQKRRRRAAVDNLERSRPKRRVV
jgi:hypothetical protein